MISFWGQQGPAAKTGARVDPRVRPKHQLTVGDLEVKIRLTEGTLGQTQPRMGRHGSGEGQDLGLQQDLAQQGPQPGLQTSSSAVTLTALGCNMGPRALGRVQRA